MFDKRLGRKAKATDALDELAFDANMIQRKQVCDKRMDKLKKKRWNRQDLSSVRTLLFDLTSCEKTTYCRRSTKNMFLGDTNMIC
mmetsp:Transcript_32007/g.57905  ORF Transcript_32007/g.57905 Transcript_32007/m.57905 type:complete len:85 (-) Transcript_32007:798-1052(-)